MFAISHRLSAVFVLLIGGLALTAGSGRVLAAEQPATEDIIKALKPTPRVTRGIATPAETARAADEARFIDSLRNRPTRSLTTVERDKISALAEQKPKIDLEINFDYDSAVIGATAMPQVTTLGEALSSADLKGDTFILAGYTDAKGTDAYNLDLSERRADAVKRLLSEKYGINAKNLVTVGYGKGGLKNRSDPFAAENRRVQVVNTTGQ